ncbi:MAG TPA: TonB-dependent receptor [Gammaproteobacteria bacterium]
MRTTQSMSQRLRALPYSVAAVLAGASAYGQDDVGRLPGPQLPPPMEEVFAVGRLQSAAESLTEERLRLPVSADFLGADVIARAGDPDIGTALRRLPGLTLIDGKFVYVRGLGERYSTVLVNGAAVPSPELTRSVIPLDLFPTSIVESVKIQKSPSPDVPAAFGGGMIDIRTTSIPNDVVATFEIGMGFNEISDGEGLVFDATGSELPRPIADAIDAYEGDVSIANIFRTLRIASPSTATIGDARAIHQGLLDSLDTRATPHRQSLDPDIDAKLALGNTWDLGETWRFGVLLNASYGDKYRNQDQYREGIGNPAVDFVDTERTSYEERTAGSINLGLDYALDHSLRLDHYVLRTDEEIASISRGFDANIRFPDQRVQYSTRLEERELVLTQLSGEHTFLDTPLVSNVLSGTLLEDLSFDWLYSESEATTDIPNQARFQATALLDASGVPASTQLFASTSAGQFSFLELDDEQTSWGGNVRLPISLPRMELTASAGWWGSEKARDYRQYYVNLNSVGVSAEHLQGTPADVLDPENLRVEHGFNLSLGSQFGTESYIAAQTIDAAYGVVDMEFDRWRLMVGARAERYRQAVLPVDLLDYGGTWVRNLQNDAGNPERRLAIDEDDVFSSLALTFDGNGLLGSVEHRIRISYGETVVRPDLREVAGVVYIDPELEMRVQGNPLLESSPIANFEIRSELYYERGDDFTISLFYKDIDSPIEQIRSAGTDDDVVLGFANAESGEVYGVELEGLKRLPHGMFFAGNLTLSDSELTFGSSLATDLTNRTRRLTGHSQWIANATLGYDSANGRHSAYLNYNAFGERIFYAGTGGNQDAFEQPFDSLGIVYKYFPRDRLELEVELDNLLDEERVFEQVGSGGHTATVLRQAVGRSYGVGVQWSF